MHNQCHNFDKPITTQPSKPRDLNHTNPYWRQRRWQTQSSHHWGGPIFPRLLSLSLFLFIFIFCCCYSLIYSRKFLFLIPACLWVWGFGFFLGFNDLEKEGILIWVWGCKKERIFVSSFGCSKGWIFGLGVAMLLRWDVGGYAFFFFIYVYCICIRRKR